MSLDRRKDWVPRNDWVVLDAQHDAHQARLEAEWQGETIAKPAHWEARAALFRRMEGRRQRQREGVALASFVQGECTDLYGRLPVLHGQDYREKIRQQARALAARKRAKGIKRSGRDG